MRIQNGDSERAIAEDHFSQWCFHHRSFKRYRLLISEPDDAQVPRSFKSKVFVFWGATGTGKTRLVHETFPDCWTSFDEQGRWFDGYAGHANVLFDDFDGCSIPIASMLKILDRYRCTLQVKGGTVNWRPRRIFITSNVDPEAWYVNALDAHRDALKRRLDVVIHFPFDNHLINFDYEYLGFSARSGATLQAGGREGLGSVNNFRRGTGQ